MKKFIAGILVGGLLFGVVPVFADGVKSLMGAKVTGIYNVEQGGKKIADGAVINGSAYVPVRAVANATGTPLTVKGKTIILDEQTTKPEGTVLSDEALEWANKSNRLKGNILSWQSLINAENEAIEVLNDKITEEKAATDKVPGRLEALEANLAKTQQRIDEYQEKINAAEAEITKLQAQIDASQK